MGKADKVLKEYFQNPAVFADAFNYLLADSGLRVDPALLREMDPDQVVLSFGLDAAVEVEKNTRFTAGSGIDDRRKSSLSDPGDRKSDAGASGNAGT